MNATENIQTRRSVRKYLDKPVPRELLEEIVATARFAPSWKNCQSVRYVFVDSPEAKEKICAEMLPVYNANTVRSAPVLAAMVTIHGRSGYERDGNPTTCRGDRWEWFDAGIACEAFCLSAWEKGLGSCIMGIFDSAIRTTARLPRNGRNRRH